MLEFKNVTKYYGNHLAVNSLSFEMNKGEILGVVGANGSGKTTTFRMLLGLLQPNAGEILFNDESIYLNKSNLFGYLPEERSLYREQSVKEQLCFLGQLKGMSKDEVLKAIEYWLEKFKISELENKQIKQLSKGNQQKIQFIGSLLHNPKILILDEPFTGLDVINVKLFKTVFEEQRALGKYILFSTHRLEEIEEFCTKVLIIKQGNLIMHGEIKAIRSKYEKRYIRLLGDIPIHKICNLRNVEKVEKDGKMIRIEIENESLAICLIPKLIKDFNVISLQYELPSLQDIFFEMSDL